MTDNSDNIKNKKIFSGKGPGRRARLAKWHRRPNAYSNTDFFPEFVNTGNGFDPEMLYVECEKCGSPVLWSEGRAAKILREAGIDPLELDSSCILLTDGCPVCGMRDEYSVRIFRSGIRGRFIPVHGHA